MGMGFRLSEYIAPDNSDDCFSFFCSAKAIRTTSCSPPAPGRASITLRSPSENRITSYACDLATDLGFDRAMSSSGRAGTGPGHALLVYLRDPTAIAWSCSTPTIR